MVQRVKIGAGGGSPFRVSASGVDVNGATFDGLIFDGNQRPMRIFSSGYIAADLIPHSAADIVIGTPGPFGPAVAAGTYSLFTVVWRHQSVPAPPLRTPVSSNGCGGAMDSSNRFHALNFGRQPLVAIPASYVNYLIFRNAG